MKTRDLNTRVTLLAAGRQSTLHIIRILRTIPRTCAANGVEKKRRPNNPRVGERVSSRRLQSNGPSKKKKLRDFFFFLLIRYVFWRGVRISLVFHALRLFSRRAYYITFVSETTRRWYARAQTGSTGTVPELVCASSKRCTCTEDETKMFLYFLVKKIQFYGSTFIREPAIASFFGQIPI